MINKFVILTITVLFSSLSYACEVHLPPHLVILGETIDFNQVLNQTECSIETMKEVNSTLGSVEGKLTSFQFSEILKSKNHNVVIHPAFFEVQHLKHLVREQLLLPAGVQLRSSEAVNSPNYLSVAPGDKIEVLCVGCLFGSQQPLNINVLGFDGQSRALTVKAEFKKMVKAFRIVGSFPAFSEITAESLNAEYVETIPHTDLLTNLESLKFYKLNKPIQNGNLLKLSDLNAINLVRAGVKTEVVIENDLIKLVTSGISRSNGTLGEFVEVFHPQKNKKYLGKVVDINKVLVEL